MRPAFGVVLAMVSLLTALVAVLALAVGAAGADKPSRFDVGASGVYAWWANPEDDTALVLWRGNEPVGMFRPATGQWEWASGGKAGKSFDVSAMLTGGPGQQKDKGKPTSGKVAGGKGKPYIVDDEGNRDDGDTGLPGVVDGSPRGSGVWRTSGVVSGEIGGKARYTIAGREVGAAEAIHAITTSDIPDDAGVVRLTVIGDVESRKRVLADLGTAGELAYWRGKFVVNDYAADHWRIRDGGFVTPRAGGVVVYVQRADGTTLWRQDTYEGPTELAKALRDRVPGYDPNKDPQPKPVVPPAPVVPDPSPSPFVPFNYWWLSVPAVLLYVLTFFRGR